MALSLALVANEQRVYLILYSVTKEVSTFLHRKIAKVGYKLAESLTSFLIGYAIGTFLYSYTII